MTNKALIPIVLVIFLISLLGSGCISKGTGDSTDTIYGMEYSGLLFPTYKIWLTHDQGLMGNQNTKTFDGTYTVDPDNTELVKKLEDAKKTGAKVKITYEEHVFGEFWKYEGTTVITDVQPA